MAVPPHASGGHAAEVARHRRTRRHRMVAVISLLQLPAIVTLAMLSHGWGGLAAVPAAALTWSFLEAYPGPWAIVPRTRAHLYLGLWPFFAWWVAAASFALLALLAAPLVAAFALPWRPVLFAALALAALVGARAVWRRPRLRRVELYRLGAAALYVNRGVGTSGPPIRVGVPAEITLLTLRRA